MPTWLGYITGTKLYSFKATKPRTKALCHKNVYFCCALKISCRIQSLRWTTEWPDILPPSSASLTPLSSAEKKHARVYNACHNNRDARLPFLGRWWGSSGGASRRQRSGDFVVRQRPYIKPQNPSFPFSSITLASQMLQDRIMYNA